MKALLITPETQSVEPIDIDGPDDIETQVGYDTIASDPVGTQGDRIYFDEECFLRGGASRFQVDTLVPISGRAVIVGAEAESDALRDVAMTADDLRGRISYL